MIPRILEPEVMDTITDAIEYDQMDFSEVNQAFANQTISLCHPTATILDIGTGTARIPILITQQLPQVKITAIDLAQNMLQIAAQNIKAAQLENQIKLELVDAKKMPYPNHSFDMIISNSIIHHLSDPIALFKEIKRLMKPNTGLLLKDLLRPPTLTILDQLVTQYASNCNQYQTKLFRDSLNASFTIPEIQEILNQVGLNQLIPYQSSDRHFSIAKPMTP